MKRLTLHTAFSAFLILLGTEFAPGQNFWPAKCTGHILALSSVLDYGPGNVDIVFDGVVTANA